MKPREPRRHVMISACLHDGLCWSDARILNISSRGLLVHSPHAPKRGSYVEICKGAHRIVARVVWVRQDRFGVQTQDKLNVDAFAAEAHVTVQDRAPLVGDRRLERRRPTAEENLERSRRRAGMMQFLWAAGLGAAAGSAAFEVVMSTLVRPLAIVSAELSSRP